MFLDFFRRKPKWKNAPDWAEAAAQNADGWWFWYRRKPFITQEGETEGKWSYEGICMRIFRGLPNESWKTTVNEKP